MNKAIIISQPDIAADTARQTLRSLGFDSINEFSSGAKARRLIMNEAPPDIIIINTPLSDEFGRSLAEEYAAGTDSAIILLCSADISDELADKLSPYDILVLSKPVNRDALRDGIRLLNDEFTPFSDIKESDEVMKRINDIRLVGRAKAMLMKYLRFTEPQAHRYLEKKAMNDRCTRRETAEKIISDFS